jgi:hypothetical protein
MIAIATLGFAPAEARSISISLENRAKGFSFVADLAEANVVLVDTDKFPTPDDWKQYCSGHSPLLVDVSENHQTDSAARGEFSASLRKPLRFSEMLSVICQVTEKHSAAGSVNACKASHADIHLTKKIVQKSISKVERKTEVVDPANYLLGFVLSAMSAASSHRFRCIHWSGKQWIVLDLLKKTAILSIKQKVLRHIAILPNEQLDISHRSISEEEMQAMLADAVYRCSFEELVWVLTQVTVRNQLQKGLSLDRSYRLKYWPNLARFPISNADIPLANLWIENSNSVSTLADRCGQPLDKACAFAACCLNCGLLEEVVASEHEVYKAPPTPIESRGRMKKVLSMILGKLAA